MTNIGWNTLRTPPRNSHNQYITESGSKGTISPSYTTNAIQRDLSPNTTRNIMNKSNHISLKKF